MIKKPVLIIAYYWPPAGGPGVQRWLKFATYLPNLGYDVTIVIPQNPDYPVLDHSLLEQVPDHVKIIKVPIQEPSRWASSLSRKRTKNLQKGIVPQQPGVFHNLLIWVRGNLFIPDARVGWKPAVLKAVKTYFTKNKSATVITTGPPHSVHLIGDTIKTLYPNVKWLADFRDPWTTIGYHNKLKLGTRARKKHIELENKVLSNADRIVVTSPYTAQEFLTKTTTPIDVITNGYDITVSNHLEQPKTPFTLAHVGTLLSDRNPEILWNVIAQLCQENQAFNTDLQIRLSGNVSDAVIGSIHTLGLQDKLVLLGYLDHQQAVTEMRNAQVLMLIEIDSDDTRAIIPGKLFEYLACRRPILAIGPDHSDIQPIIATNTAGSYFTYADQQQLKDYVLSRYQDYRNMSNRGNFNERIKQYHRSELTQQLDQSINALWE